MSPKAPRRNPWQRGRPAALIFRRALDDTEGDMYQVRVPGL